MAQNTHASPEAAGPAASPLHPAGARRGRPAEPRPGADPADADVDPFMLAGAVARERGEGWTPIRMRIFIDRLSETGNVGQCCRELDLSRQSAYALRRRNELFARAWDGAIIRSRDALLDAAWQRAYHGVAEEVVVDGKLTERQSKPDGAMLRYLLTRADRIAENPALSALPAKRAEFRLEELIDCLDPERAEDEEAPDETALLKTINGEKETGSCGWDAPEPHGFASDEEAIDSWLRYDKVMSTPPDEIDIADIDPEQMDDWTDDQWLRAERSGLLDRIGFYDEEQDEPGDEETDGSTEEGADPVSNMST